MRIGRGAYLFFAVMVLLLVAAPPVLADEAGDLLRNSAIAIGCGVVFLLVLSACSLYTLYFLYTDAEARSGNGVLWLILGVVAFWPIVLIVWLIIRPEKKV